MRTRLDEGVRAVVDRRRVDVIVANLVGNALRHGAPPVTVTPGTRTGADGAWGVLEVADHGPGPPPEVRERVFDRFYKADASRARGTADDSGRGGGLGTLVRELGGYPVTGSGTRGTARLEDPYTGNGRDQATGRLVCAPARARSVLEPAARAEDVEVTLRPAGGPAVGPHRCADFLTG
ncbi:hypothetical protein ADL06_20840 [Streptomyces sp. NRRL F-6491]|nr:hypothetical protein ADL06_20840 [Streptomyces sp. NRRL F-6491]KOX38912.1 hypothetical protein ADL08_25955 [Streptomyces sp. NRRL F-6492]